MLSCLASVVFLSTGTRAQANVEISIDPALGTAVVKGKMDASAGPLKNLSFLPSAIGYADLGKRISKVSLIDRLGQNVGHRAFNSAEYVAENSFTAFHYSLNLSPPPDPRSAAHVSWVSGDAGLIYLEDVLPRGIKRATVKFQLPNRWAVRSSTKPAGTSTFEVEDARKAVFVVGDAIRSGPATGSKSGADLVILGNWLFTDVEAGVMAAEVLEEYRRIFGTQPTAVPTVVLLSMPQEGAVKGMWEAETRGSTVVIASADMPFRTQSLQRLHEQLRHELFHLWLPNGVNLTGKYDWFYEGFALYQSLKTGVSLNRIRFDDMLDTLSRAHNIDKSEIERRSLLEASNDRWAGSETIVYARGMLVAFLVDIAMMRATGGKTTIESMLRSIYASHRGTAAPADGNTELLNVLKNDPSTASIARDHVSGSKPIDWNSAIQAAGLENEAGTSRTKLRVRSELTGRQKAILDKLGYNSWRKLTRK